jgi:hypothetical protein
MPFSEKKSLAQEQLAAAYSLDYLTVTEYEERVGTLEMADTYDVVEAVVADLPRDLARRPAAGPVAPLYPEAQLLEGGGQILRRRGNWLRSNRLIVSQRGSVLRLRFDDLAELQGARLDIDLDLHGCTARIKVPIGTRIMDDVSAHGSVFRVSRRISRHGSPTGPIITLSGSVFNSVIRIGRL